jgi:hypothetical protein
VPLRTMLRIERGEGKRSPQLSVLARLAVALKVTVADLVDPEWLQVGQESARLSDERSNPARATPETVVESAAEPAPQPERPVTGLTACSKRFERPTSPPTTKPKRFAQQGYSLVAQSFVVRMDGDQRAGWAVFLTGSSHRSPPAAYLVRGGDGIRLLRFAEP